MAFGTILPSRVAERLSLVRDRARILGVEGAPTPSLRKYPMAGRPPRACVGAEDMEHGERQ